ncbi:TPA: DUF4326 domain-containing protein [Klebsiella pneumoniae]|jgi:hypothetical protein|uniref:DUF4326 domain-containing protein n=1 Tax=Klebsiella pneumoniae TaxID=573 RepID=UPI000E2C6F65|nr:DUF4326 domain-containing protein [Klebsiella pneumoniae]MBC5760436.1 DUF4326 domain-containing protein [Klebsiella pneumoniae]MBQ5098244.1 DUF4326 domain-containing protein [Klebsiella pneumoniae]WQO23409.1 DUF4326 domain-containing protein [Klebsiella pneumoniae subsp. pneumoniae]SWM03008.1 Uncharacterised protein [Klebsiella pneumoniae]HBS5686910.1 DUF4326 domain-containing protein [Klebsiella pneumoniae]
MIKILIMYHPSFASSGKFERKLTKILSTLDDYQILYFDDPASLICNFFDSKSLKHLDDNVLGNIVQDEKLTHAVFFDSTYSPEFTTVKSYLSEVIPVRYIQDKITFVSNKDKGEHFDTYIGRGTLWGNPYAIGQDGDREEVIRKFAYDFNRGFLRGGEDFNEKLKALRGHTLGCHCKPYACHGDVLADYLNKLDDGE